MKQLKYEVGNSLKLTSYWLISDLIPKKYEKFEFSKTFVTMFLSGQSWPRKTKF